MAGLAELGTSAHAATARRVVEAADATMAPIEFAWKKEYWINNCFFSNYWFTYKY